MSFMRVEMYFLFPFLLSTFFQPQYWMHLREIEVKKNDKYI